MSVVKIDLINDDLSREVCVKPRVGREILLTEEDKGTNDDDDDNVFCFITENLKLRCLFFFVWANLSLYGSCRNFF